jgi:hypothetical protein
MPLADYIQESPDHGHDSGDHSYNPDDHGVCLDCGWWDIEGDSCPGCGVLWEEHSSLDVLLEELTLILLDTMIQDLESRLKERSLFQPGTNHSWN